MVYKRKSTKKILKNNKKKTKRKIPSNIYGKYKNNMNKLVISINNDLGKKRRKKLNYKFKHIEGVTESPKWIVDNFKLYHTEDINSRKTRGKMGCFSSHVKTLQYIVDNKLNNTVILEDDAFLDGNIIGKFPNDGACLLGGTLRHPNNWTLDNKFRKNKVKGIIKKFKQGVNVIDYDKYRWTQTHAIYYPKWEVAKEILYFIKNTNYKFKHFDLFLCDHKLVKYLHYPSIFTHDDRESESQINKKNGYIKNYVL